MSYKWATRSVFITRAEQPVSKDKTSVIYIYIYRYRGLFTKRFYSSTLNISHCCFFYLFCTTMSRIVLHKLQVTQPLMCCSLELAKSENKLKVPQSLLQCGFFCLSLFSLTIITVRRSMLQPPSLPVSQLTAGRGAQTFAYNCSVISINCLYTAYKC